MGGPMSGGAGSAGRVLAYRLAEEPDMSVVLLEASSQDDRPLLMGYSPLVSQRPLTTVTGRFLNGRRQ